jgi:hypothetical protein
VQLLPRYLCLARERLLVLEAHPTRMGVAAVKSNHHISELAKLTYSRKEPRRLTLWRRQLRVAPLVSHEEGEESGADAEAGGVTVQEQLVERCYLLDNAAEFRTLLVQAIGRL